MSNAEIPQAGGAGPELGLREESAGDLIKALSTDLSTLMRQELRLAQAEMTDKGKAAGIGIGMFGAAGLFALLGLLALTTTVIALLATTMKVWIAALIVTAVYVLIAGALALIGRNKVSQATPLAPEQTTETLKEDAQWAKAQVPSAKK
jgi:uncharacterized membrane protein YqjE